MALYEYHCQKCDLTFEEISSPGNLDAGKCPKCKGKDTKKLISKFAVTGRGDLRESTQHGCHDNFSGSDHGHDHGNDHGDGNQDGE